MLYYKEMQQKSRLNLKKGDSESGNDFGRSLETIAMRDCEADIYRDGRSTVWYLKRNLKSDRKCRSYGPIAVRLTDRNRLHSSR